MRSECEFEAEVLAAVMECRWPEAAQPELREHASQCQICSETALVAAAVSSERNELRASAIVPDSGPVWWRAQIRARREALAAVDRPITIVHMVVFACATGLLGACFGATSAWFQLALHSVMKIVAEHGRWIGSAVAILVAIAGGAYVALEREERKVSGLPEAHSRPH